jgi:hypothetical protein
MQGKTDFITVKRKTIVTYIVILIALAIATPALADYLGPNRTVTEWSSVCKILLMECKYVPSKDDYRYKKVDDWSCSLESKPWKSYPDQPSSQGCFSATEGDQYVEQSEVLQQTTTTHPPATITGTLQNCTLQNGWCVTVPQLDLSAGEPLSGYNILAIEGTLNGQTFACSDTNCSVALNEGDNDFAFWALSSWGDTSTMGTLSAKVDSISPSVGLDISGSNGSNGWFTSPAAISAFGADSGSGLADASLSVDGGIWQPSTTLNEGVYNILVRATDYAGNVSTSSTTISVDTTTPSINVSINGTLGGNGWYKTTAQVSASASDATSGVGTLEVSMDGSPYQRYTSPVSFSDGQYAIQFKATDNAGNVTESTTQHFSVDTLAPEIFVLESWTLGESSEYLVQDFGSGLAFLRVVIEDEDERFAKVAWNEDVMGEKFKGYIDWDGIFKDGTVAPPGMYFAWIKASDIAGNEYVALGGIIVPEPNTLLRLFQPESGTTTIPTPPSELFEDEDQLSPTVQPIQTTSTTGSLVFGGSTAQAGTSTAQSLVLNAGTAASETRSSNVLWGATAAAVLGAATAYALEENRKRKEAEEAQRAAIVARIEEMEAQKEAALQARKVAQWLEGQQLFNAQLEKARLNGASEEEIDALKKKGATQGFGSAIDSTKSLVNSLERSRAEIDRRDLEEEKALLEKLAEKVSRDDDTQEQLAGLAAYYEAMRQGEREAQPVKTWWQKSLDWIDNHQVEIALGVGIVVGVAAIILSGGTATPLVAAAWVAGAAVVAGGTVALGTLGLNAYYQRPLGTNVLRNMGYAAGAAAVTATAGFALNAISAPVTKAVGSFCTAHITTCAVAAPAFKAIDYGWTGYDVWQANRILSSTNTSLEAKLIASVDIGLAAWSEGLEPDETLPLSLPLDDVIRRELRDKFAEILEKEGKDAAFAYLKKVLGDIPFNKLAVMDDDVLEYAASEGPDALKALSAWSEKDLKEHGVELVLRAKRDGEVLKDVQTLISNGPINPNKLTNEQERLIKAIAANSTQYDEAGQIVLGKWVDYDEGFAKVARDTGSVHYNPHPDMWNMLEELGEKERNEVAWLINEQVIQNGIEKGLPFEYTLDGIPAKDISAEKSAVQLIFSGATDVEIKSTLRLDYLPIRMQELQELRQAGYEFVFDDINGSFIFSMP